MSEHEIFNNYPLKHATSNKSDGHMSYGKVSRTDTNDNILRFLKNLKWQVMTRVFLRIKYDKSKTYDQISLVDKDTASSGSHPELVRVESDALITTEPGVALLLPTADCYPITLFDPKNRVLALAHVGWHSSSARLLTNVIDRMRKEFNSSSKDLLVHIGPGIPAKYYVFDDPIQLSMPDWKPFLKRARGGWGIDLLGYNQALLKESGVETKNIKIDKRNTAESDELESNYLHNKQGLQEARRFLTAVMMGN